uniref:Uncharacterized protein n=1 Tax=Anguilla anguilla TaxID=7936 RepID=A0A0E9WDL9_ANGAN
MYSTLREGQAIGKSYASTPAEVRIPMPVRPVFLHIPGNSATEMHLFIQNAGENIEIDTFDAPH